MTTTEIALLSTSLLAAIAIGVVFHLAKDVHGGRATGRPADADESAASHG